MSSNKRPEDPDSVRQVVAEGYTRIAESKSGCCTPSCGGGAETETHHRAREMGYSTQQLETLPEGANLGLGCGNPTAIDTLEPGEVVVDLGSGAGIDVFLAAEQVGDEGRVIGVDMTDAMLEKARKNAAAGGFHNVEFRKGTIEELPVEDESVDAILSNCVINLSPEKDKVFREAFRVLKPGGRMMISDIVLERELPRAILDSIDALLGCVGGASLRSDYLGTIREAGFSEIRVVAEKKYGEAFSASDPNVQRMAKDYGISLEQVETVLQAVTSLHLFVRK